MHRAGLCPPERTAPSEQSEPWTIWRLAGLLRSVASREPSKWFHRPYLFNNPSGTADVVMMIILPVALPTFDATSSTFLGYMHTYCETHTESTDAVRFQVQSESWNRENARTHGPIEEPTDQPASQPPTRHPDPLEQCCGCGWSGTCHYYLPAAFPTVKPGKRKCVPSI